MNNFVWCYCAVLVSVAVSIAGGVNSEPRCAFNGQTYELGTMFDGPDAFYYCKRNGVNGTTIKPIGCVQNNQRVYDLALYQKGDNYFRCRVDDSGVSAEVWGCALRNPDGTYEPKSIACTWEIKTDPIGYVNCCQQQGGTAVITQLYCLYSYMGGRIQVNAGCYRLFDDVAAGCRQNPDGVTLSMTTWSAANADTDPSAAGLSQC